MELTGDQRHRLADGLNAVTVDSEKWECGGGINVARAPAYKSIKVPDEDARRLLKLHRDALRIQGEMNSLYNRVIMDIADGALASLKEGEENGI